MDFIKKILITLDTLVIVLVCQVMCSLFKLIRTPKNLMSNFSQSAGNGLRLVVSFIVNDKEEGESNKMTYMLYCHQ